MVCRRILDGKVHIYFAFSINLFNFNKANWESNINTNYSVKIMYDGKKLCGSSITWMNISRVNFVDNWARFFQRCDEIRIVCKYVTSVSSRLDSLLMFGYIRELSVYVVNTSMLDYSLSLLKAFRCLNRAWVLIAFHLILYYICFCLLSTYLYCIVIFSL